MRYGLATADGSQCDRAGADPVFDFPRDQLACPLMSSHPQTPLPKNRPHNAACGSNGPCNGPPKSRPVRGGEPNCLLTATNAPRQRNHRSSLRSDSRWCRFFGMVVHWPARVRSANVLDMNDYAWQAVMRGLGPPCRSSTYHLDS